MMTARFLAAVMMLAVFPWSAAQETITVRPKSITEPSPAAELLAKTRARYDLPWARGLLGIHCDGKMDWRGQFRAVAKGVPHELQDVLGVLEAQTMHVDATPSGVNVVHEKPEVELSAVAKAAMMQEGSEAVLRASYGAWMPVSQGVLFPLGPTCYQFEMLPEGYKLSMDGPDVHGTLTLDSRLEMTGGVMDKPQPLRFATKFIPASDAGLVLHSLITTPGGEIGHGNDAQFRYEYTVVDGFEIPTTLDTVSSNGVPWHFALQNCRVDRGVQVAPGSLPRRQ